MNEISEESKSLASSRPARRRPWGAVGGWAVVAAFLFAAVLLGMSAARKAGQAGAEARVQPPHPVRVWEVQAESVEDRITLPGRVMPSFDAILAASKPGRLEEWTAGKGARVAAGEVLARLDARAWEARVHSAEVEAREADANFKRWEQLFKTGAVPGKERDDARARRDVAEAVLADARVAADQCVVKAPAAGVITDRRHDVGEFLPEGAALFQLVNMNPAKLVVDVPEQSVVEMQPGMNLLFRVDAWPDTVFTGAVSFVSSVALPQNNSYRVEAVVPNEDGRLKGGMIARVDVVRGRTEQAVAIPVSAMVPRRGDLVVFVEQGGRAARRVVRITRFVDDRAVLAGGLAPGERLILEGHRSLADGAAVQVVDHAPAQGGAKP